MIEARVVDLGVVDYRVAWQAQLALVEERKLDQGYDTLLLAEHPHVITLGRRRSASDNVLDPGDIPVVDVERGGDVTYHGPGQLVAYPIVKLAEHERDLHKFLRALEEATIATLRDLDVPNAGREPGKTGVWTRGRKLASIGIACRRWVTFHGLALNLSTDLAYFARLNPCGFDASVMTSASALLGRPVPVAEAKRPLTDHLGKALSRRFSFS